MIAEKRLKIERSKKRSEKIVFWIFRSMTLLVVGILFAILGFIVTLQLSEHSVLSEEVSSSAFQSV